MTSRRFALFCVASILGAACDASDDPGLDAGPRPDGAAVPMDSSAGPADSSLPSDAWTAPESCETPGAMRSGPCGARCGVASQRCTDGVWVNVSACLMEGECEAGAFETRHTIECAEETRICTNECGWTDWESTGPRMGECNVRMRRRAPSDCPAGAQVDEICSEDCAWERVAGAVCTDECGDTARTEPEWAREVCIPFGHFTRGGAGYEDTVPAATVMLSAYYIDAYPVTNRRYAACVAAGSCTASMDNPTTLADFMNPARADFPVRGIWRAQAMEFCAWDGGRVLPTEARWERAARGDTPSRRVYPWGDELRCDIADCSGTRPPTDPLRFPYAYDGAPGTRSLHGTYLQAAGVLEWTSDYWSRTYYGEGPSVRDPTGPASGPGFTLRGSTVYSVQPLILRMVVPLAPAAAEASFGFRCARDAPGVITP